MGDNASGMDDDARAAERLEDAALVERARADDPDAFGKLYDRWFDRVHDLAFRVTGESAAAADVAQDSFLSAWNHLSKLQDPAAFGGWLLRITRNAALDRRRREQRTSPYDADSMAMIEASGPSPASAPVGFRIEDRARAFDAPEQAAEDGDLAALVWESAAALGERDAELLDLSLRHGLTPAEVGEIVGLNRNAANQAVHRVRSRLKAAIEARVLWRSGEPVCEGLAGALATAGVTRFGPDAVRVIGGHADKCAACQEQRETRLEPSALFGAIPFIVVPLVLKMKVAHALSESGVPMDGSAAAAADADGRGLRRKHRRGRRVAVVGGVLVVAFVVVGVAAEDLDELPTLETAAAKKSPVTTTSPSPVSTTIPPAVTVTTQEQGDGPGAFVPPPTAPSTPPSAPTATASISVSPGSVAGSYGWPGGAPRVVWSTSGGASVSVTWSGPAGTHSAGIPSTAATGNVGVCPGLITGAPTQTCRPRPGTHTYTVTVRDASGNIAVQRSATLTAS